MAHHALLALCLTATWVVSRAQRPTATVSDGQLQGITMETWQGRTINAFLSIPFAAPPVGPLRFLPPQPATPWQGVLDAGSPAPTCVQYSPPGVVEGQEDCLYLNVYTPKNPTTSGPLPVLVFFFPGAFMAGSSSYYGPRYLLDYDIVLVIPNYRLGIMGFLSTGDGVIPGNMGLKDQVAALQWVKTNIYAFGGNPSEVTLAGASAGGQSVSYHFISSLSQGLFKRGISMSGSCLQPSARMKAPLYKTITVASTFNCPTNSTSELAGCLQTIPADTLVQQEGMFQYFYYTPIEVFGPTVEPDLPGAFITQGAYQRLRTGEVFEGPILFSTTTQEGLVPALLFLVNATGLSYMNTNWLQVAPSLLDYLYTVTSENRNSVSLKIREYYFGNSAISLATNQSIIQMLGDRTWEDDVETNARIQAYVQPAPVYYYHFGYRGQYSIFNVVTGSNLDFGVAHTDDLMYILNSTTYPRPENIPGDRAMISLLSQLWANFVINGVASVGPTVEWIPINSSDAMNGPINYLFISSATTLIPSTVTTFGHPTFWNNLPINEPGSGRPAFSSY